MYVGFSLAARRGGPPSVGQPAGELRRVGRREVDDHHLPGATHPDVVIRHANTRAAIRLTLARRARFESAEDIHGLIALFCIGGVEPTRIAKCESVMPPCALAIVTVPPLERQEHVGQAVILRAKVDNPSISTRFIDEGAMIQVLLTNKQPVANIYS